MKIKIINPDYGMTDQQLRYREEVLSQVVEPTTELSMECLTETKVWIDSQVDVALASPEILSMAKKAESEGYDAVVLYCLSDPAIIACRELLTIPVIGGGQSSFSLASNLGYNMGLLTTGVGRIPEKYEFVKHTGIEPSRLVAVKGIEVSLVDARKDIDATIECLVQRGRQLVEEDGAQVIILGCLSFLGMAEVVSKELGVPVIDPAFAAVSLAESIVKQKLSHSKKAYPYPPKGERKWNAGLL